MIQEPTHIFNDIRDTLARANRVLITSHRDCDGDSVGGQLAALAYVNDLGVDCQACHHGPVPDTLQGAPGWERIIDISSDDERVTRLTADFDVALVLECSDLDRLGDVRRLIGPETTVINVDHHADNTGFGSVIWQDSSASSVCEMLARFFSAVGFDYDRETAEALYIGILTDTGRFRYNSATAQTFATTSEIVSRGISVQEICDRIFFARRPQSVKLTGLALSDVRFAADDRVCVIPLSAAALERAGAEQGDTEGLVDYTLVGKATRVGAFIRDNGSGRVKVSLRSRGKLDVSAIAASFGGGGHRNAAGCTLDGSVEAATELITARLVETVGSK